MSDLPNREKFNEQYPDDWPVGWRDVLDAYASGRLADSEAINYKAARDEAQGRGYPMSYLETRAVVDSAIGDTAIRQPVKEIVEQDQELLDRLAET